MTPAFSHRPSVRVSGKPPIAAAATELKPLLSLPGIYSAFQWHNVVMIVWVGPVTVESIPIIEQHCQMSDDSCPQRCSTVHIFVPGCKEFPTAEARSEFGRITRTYGHQSPLNAVVIPGSGFWASAARGLVTAFAMLAPRGVKLRIFATSREVAMWLPAAHEKSTGALLDPAVLLLAIERACEIGKRLRANSDATASSSASAAA